MAFPKVNKELGEISQPGLIALLFKYIKKIEQV
jgi:hypothetical protein